MLLLGLCVARVWLGWGGVFCEVVWIVVLLVRCEVVLHVCVYMLEGCVLVRVGVRFGLVEC